MRGYVFWLMCGGCLLACGCNESSKPPGNNVPTGASNNTSPTGENHAQRPADKPSTGPLTTDSQADAAFQKLLDATESSNPEAWSQAEEALTKLGTQSVPTYIRELGSGNRVARELAVQFLAQLGPEAKAAEQALISVLQDESTSVRVNAAATLLAMNSSSQAAVAALKAMLHDEGPLIRLPAAISLSSLPETESTAVTVLAELLKESDASIRLTAVKTLGRLGEKARASLADVESLTTDTDAEVQAAAKEAAQAISGDSK